jgi:hypothetical protein
MQQYWFKLKKKGENLRIEYSLIIFGITSKVLVSTGKSLSEALIFASINPQYDNRLFMELPVQYMKTTSAGRAGHMQNMFLPCSASDLRL